MRILGLDMATKTGFAILDDGKLISEGLLTIDKTMHLDLMEDLRLFLRAKAMANKIRDLINQYNPDQIFIEQTNQGKFRSSQKQLEFVHCLVISGIYDSFFYLSKFAYVNTSKWRSSLDVRLTKEQSKHNKKVKDKVARGKITPKHLAVAWANSTFGLKLKLKDNDRADALALAMFGHLNGMQKSVSYDIDSIVLNKTN